MTASNLERVGRALQLLAAGLRPVVERTFAKALGPDWLDRVVADKEQATGRAVSPNLDDPAFLLDAISRNWNETLGAMLGPTERRYVNELRETRNRWAHHEAFTLDDTYRAFDTAQRVLAAVSAPQASELERWKQDVLRERYEVEARRTARRVVAEQTVVGPSVSGLPAWREVIEPHPDVAAGRYQQAEFAADLDQVHRGAASPEYQDPVEFFRRTYLTEGLRRLLGSALRRLGESDGDPVIELQTTFGGGKTHSMIALYHLADPGHRPAELPGLDALVASAEVRELPRVRRVVLAGQALPPGQPWERDGQAIRTFWGELAWQLGGSEGYDLVADSDRAGVSPGSAIIRTLLERFGPALILVDEWLTFLRQLWAVDGLPAGSFDANLSFAHALAEAVRATPNSLLVASLPSSEVEVGGEGGRMALARLKDTYGRLQSPWRPASPEEGFEIVRRRLFQALPADRAAARDAVVQHFSELYARYPGDFPSETREAEYRRRMERAYPIHPELFDRLFGDWASLDRFQQTRGVLKLMAVVVHVLYERGDRSPLILPSSIPLDDELVVSQLTQYLEDQWVPIIASDVDGPASLPLAVDRENPAFQRYAAARRVARTVFFGSAPTLGAANRGIEDRSIKLGAVLPGESPATFGDALRTLAGRATYLYENRGRYWYSTQPSVNRLARDRAEGVAPEAVREEIVRRLRAERDRGAFARVHVAPRSGGDVPDEDEVGLVVLGPEHPHSRAGGGSRAREAAAAILADRAAGARMYRNMLVFLAADEARLAELEGAVREFLAWSSICADARSLNLDAMQSEAAERQRRQADETVAVRIPETYVWALVPSQAEAVGGSLDWSAIRVAGDGSLAARTARKLVAEGLLLTRFGGPNLRLVLDEHPGMWSEAG
ncbi:MAG TPA: Swt1 family HEPN domain-containing protein, partial [Candidatus Binatia bacterium]|nr:Swt1 family HEPN domain-containing protein [Candidatus Binatia bacterium]